MKDGDCVSKIQKVAIKFKNLLSENEQLKLQAENASLNLNWLKIRNSPKVETMNYDLIITEENEKDPSFLYQWRPFASKFPLTYKLACAVQVLPYSTVSIERKFSQLTDIKTLKRNRLSVENLQACLFVKQEFKDEKLREEIFERFLSEKYQKDSSPEKKIYSQNNIDVLEQEERKELELGSVQLTQKDENVKVEDKIYNKRRSPIELGTHELKKFKLESEDEESF